MKCVLAVLSAAPRPTSSQRTTPHLWVHEISIWRICGQTAPTMVEIVVAAMESVPAGFSVPLRVEIKMRRTWAECK